MMEAMIMTLLAMAITTYDVCGQVLLFKIPSQLSSPYVKATVKLGM